MINKAPAFQWYPGDYLGSQRVQLLTLEEEGAYLRLLCYCWIHGSIPADPDLLAKLIGKGASTTLATRVSTMFQAGGSDRLVHDRLDAERRKQEQWRKKSSEGGKKSVKLRAERHAKKADNQRLGEWSSKSGSNQSSTLQSPISDLQSPSTNDPNPSAGAADVRHHQIASRWGELYRGAFGADYSFHGRDAAALKRFLTTVKDPAEELLTIVIRAWERTKQDKFARRCKEAATIHGFCTFYNEIRVELATSRNGTPADELPLDAQERRRAF